MTVQQVRLHHFKASEFDQTDLGGENWWPYMSLELLYRLDALRGAWEEPIKINRVIGALGRRDSSGSQHNVCKWREVRAVDIHCELSELAVSADRIVRTFIDFAKQAGFTGIAFYPDWNNAGFHLDVRKLEHGKKTATWGRIGKEYVSLDAALKHYRNKLRG